MRQAGGNPLALSSSRARCAPGSYAWTELDDELPMTARLERPFAARADELDPAARAVLDVAALDDGDELSVILAAAEIVHGRRWTGGTRSRRSTSAC